MDWKVGSVLNSPFIILSFCVFHAMDVWNAALSLRGQ